MSTEAKLHRQNERFELLLNLTTQITSSLDLREALRAVAANIREVIHADAVVMLRELVASGLLDFVTTSRRVFSVCPASDANGVLEAYAGALYRYLARAAPKK